MKRFLLILLFLLLGRVYGQSDTLRNCINQNNWLRNEMQLNVGMVFYSALQITTEGEKLLNAKSIASPILGLTYKTNLNKYLGFNLGGDFSIIGFNYSYDFTVPDNHVLSGQYLEFNSKEYEIFNTSFITEVFYKFKIPSITSKIYFILSGGVRYQRTSQFEDSVVHSYYIDKNQPEIDVFYMHLKSSDKIDFLTYTIKIGALIANKELNSYQINLFGNLGSSTIARGEFEFYNVPQQSKGRTYLKSNFIGISLSYNLGLRKPT